MEDPSQHWETDVLIAGTYGRRGNVRRYMEDTVSCNIRYLNKTQKIHFFATNDGHSGVKTAKFLKEKHFDIIMEGWYEENPNDERPKTSQFLNNETLEKLFLKVDEEFEKVCDPSGSTCCSVLVFPFKDTVKVICCNIGDSRAIMMNDGKLIALSRDHKPDVKEEKKRVNLSGKFRVFHMKDGTGKFHTRIGNKCDPFAYHIGLSRAFGDFKYKNAEGKTAREQAIIAIPEIKRETINVTKNCWKKKRVIVNNPKIIINASDGLWDVVSNEEAMEFVKKELEAQKRDLDAIENFDETKHFFKPEVIAKKLCHEAIENRKSTDNVTVTIILIKSWV